jgi:hypothetical protein
LFGLAALLSEQHHDVLSELLVMVDGGPHRAGHVTNGRLIALVAYALGPALPSGGQGASLPPKRRQQGPPRSGLRRRPYP